VPQVSHMTATGQLKPVPGLRSAAIARLHSIAPAAKVEPQPINFTRCPARDYGRALCGARRRSADGPFRPGHHLRSGSWRLPRVVRLPPEVNSGLTSPRFKTGEGTIHHARVSAPEPCVSGSEAARSRFGRRESRVAKGLFWRHWPWRRRLSDSYNGNGRVVVKWGSRVLERHARVPDGTSRIPKRGLASTGVVTRGFRAETHRAA
jgi:hypothetical protein